MNPFIVFDAQKVVPDAFALALATAARTRALRSGADPRVDLEAEPGPHLALSEIAAGAFTTEDMKPFLFTAGTEALHVRQREAAPKLCDDRPLGVAAYVPAEGTVH
jgi:DNA-directed RNA polymerase subunit omega